MYPGQKISILDFTYYATRILKRLGISNNGSPSVFASGTAYSLTATPAAVTFGTTSPALTLSATAAGAIYMITARAQLKYNGATFAASRTPTLKLRRTNSTATDVTNGSVTSSTAVVTTLTDTYLDQAWSVPYTTVGSGDIISLFGSIDVVPTAGSLDVVAASITVIRIG